jgi:hypothetical protein
MVRRPRVQQTLVTVVWTTFAAPDVFLTNWIFG